jgi:riboflavin synthase
VARRVGCFFESTLAKKKNSSLTHPGIVQGVATISAVDRRAAGAATLGIDFPPGALTGITIGASIAINGTCLTVRTKLETV